jgi:hypothetical protein
LGFTLWVDSELAWAAGTYEYRPFGVAVISNTDLFRLSDFRQKRPAPPARDPSFVGYFASLGEVNVYLTKRRTKRRGNRLARELG